MINYKNLEKLLKSKQITMYKLGKDCGISQTILSLWKSGKSTPKADKLQKMADYLEVPVSYFTTGELIERPQNNFSDEDLLLARELNKSDKIELIKDIMKIYKDSDVKVLKELTKIFLERK